MLKRTSPAILFSVVLLVLTTFSGIADAEPRTSIHYRTSPRSAAGPVQERNVRAHMEFLASDALQGRGSATQYEYIAALYIAAQLRQFGVLPAGDVDASGQKTFLQKIPVAPRRSADFTPADPAAETRFTWNVVGELRGTDRNRAKEVVLLSAHMDHLGVRSSLPGDNIFNGADDDASGVVAVLEMARNLAGGTKPKRTILFVLFGSEEIGGFGSRHFIQNPPYPLTDIVANVNFEMIGRPDAKVAADTLWLTGFERSSLGPELARRGARLVADPHPEQNFFRRSDNYVLARRGVIAHTVSSFGLHPEYHQPNDDLVHIDFTHMTRAIGSMVQPLRWLVNSDFRPAWNEGQKP